MSSAPLDGIYQSCPIPTLDIMPQQHSQEISKADSAQPFIKEEQVISSEEIISEERSVSSIIVNELKNIRLHHQQMRRQLHFVFIVSMCSFALGFMVLLASIWMLLTDKTDLRVAAIAAIAGGFVSLIGGVCLRLYEKILAHQQDHHTGLFGTYEVITAIELCQEIADLKQRDAAKEKLSYQIVSTRKSLEGGREPPSGEAKRKKPMTGTKKSDL